MTAHALTAAAPRLTSAAAPPSRLALLTLCVLAAHVLVLMGLPHWLRSAPASDGSAVFLIRTLTLAAPRSTSAAIPAKADQATQRTAPAPRARPIEALKPRPLQYTEQDKSSSPALPAPRDQAPVTRQQSMPPGQDDAPAPVQLPRPARIDYQATIDQNGHLSVLPSTIDWHHDAQSYDLCWRLASPAIGDRSQSASGAITAQGLAPATTGPADTPLPASALDPLSAIIELSALISGDPAHYTVGQRITLPVAHGDGAARDMAFIIAGDEDLQAGGLYADQPLPALHLVHRPASDQDARIELWLGQQMDWLPLRMLVVNPTGERLELMMQDIHAL